MVSATVVVTLALVGVRVALVSGGKGDTTSGTSKAPLYEAAMATKPLPDGTVQV